MRRRATFAAQLSITVFAVLLLLAPASAQQRETVLVVPRAAESPRTGEIDGLLAQGRQMEVEGRWGEALSHYEDAVRTFPDEVALQRRYEFARAHYDVGRRYVDRSFQQMLTTLPVGRALDLYGEVLLKIQSHYVDTPNWKELVERGTNHLEVALSEPVFVERNVSERERPAVNGFRAELRQLLGPRVIQTREAAREAAALAAQLAQQRLGVSPTAVVMEYLCGAANTLDPYSAYLTPDQLNEVYSQIEGNFVGLGVELKAIQAELVIVRVIPRSPAEQAGVRADDRVVAVDGRLTQNVSTDQAANLLQGEDGSIVDLTVATPGQAPRQLRIRRQRVEVPSIDQVKLLDRASGVGYLRLTCFQKTTQRDLEAALWQLYREGMKSLIMDLRGNPGGLLTTAVDVADLFLERGTIVSTHGRSPQEDFTYSARPAGTWLIPLVVIIDQDSASAAEIFAGAIHDHRRGTIIGTRSYGKGSVQGIFPLDLSNAGIRLTTAKFYSPTGRPYSHVGVEPDVTVYRAARAIDGTNPSAAAPADDPMLAAALQAARGVDRTQQARNMR